MLEIMDKHLTLKVYLVLALLFGLWGIVDILLSWLSIGSGIYLKIITVCSLLFILFNIIIIPLFHHQRQERIAYVLPAYYLISSAIYLLLGVLAIYFTTMPSWSFELLFVLSLVSGLFETVFSAYLLWRKPFPQQL